MLAYLSRPWPWYVAGPLIGLVVPLLLVLGNKLFGISGNFRHICAAAVPGRAEFLRYDWKRAGGWNLAFALGIVAGGFVGGVLLGSPEPVAISARTQAELAVLGIGPQPGPVPAELFGWSSVLTLKGLVVLVAGGFLVGFGTSYAGGCTSGHAISGLADFQLPSLVAVIGFFAGGLVTTYVILPLVL